MKFYKIFFLVFLLLLSVSSVLALVQLQDNQDAASGIFHLHLEENLYPEVTLNITASGYDSYDWVATDGDYYVITDMNQLIISVYKGD